MTSRKIFSAEVRQPNRLENRAKVNDQFFQITYLHDGLNDAFVRDQLSMKKEGLIIK